MTFDQEQRQQLKRELAKRIEQGFFEKLVLLNKDEGFECQVQGELFSVLGVLGHVIHDFSVTTKIPVHVLATYLELAAEIVQDVENFTNNKQDTEQDFTQFMSILTGEPQEDE